ncbi:HAD domain-containing protein [Sharpea azabuensis]|uniref:HAD domain-containing protein n=2 Tax=Sharpea TaxID=519427 RepID=UPI00156C3079|nr:HAD domain-containing protein [Sharpea azabuensis]
MDKVIFLDIDGVLNNASTSNIVETTGFIGVDERNVRVLVKLMKEVEADIVLSSTWQADQQMYDYLTDTLKQYDIHISDQTNEKGILRGTAIRQYIKKHDVKHYVVIDDWMFPDFLKGSFLKHVIRSDEMTGLKEEQIPEIIRALSI